MAPDTVATIVLAIWATVPAIAIFKMKDNDSGLLVPFEKKPNRWSPRRLISKIVILGLMFTSFEVKIGRFVNQYLLVGAFLANGLWMFLYVPPSSGIHRRGLYLSKHQWIRWEKIREYRWIDSGTLEVNPGFFSFSYQKVKIPEEFATDLQAMLDSQCPDCEIRAK